MISQTVEYALRAMVHLAALAPGTTATSQVIAQKSRIPQGYLSKVLRDLVVAGLIQSQRGPNGGFSLVGQPGDISMLDIVNAVDPIRRILSCPLGNPEHLKLCPLHRRIDDAIAEIERSLASSTLAEIVKSQLQPGQCRAIQAEPVKLRTPRSG